MNLLLDAIAPVATTGDPSGVEVTGIEHDSRQVGPGDLFCCLPGRATDGHDHADEAVGRGAVGLVCERPVGKLSRPVVQVRVASARPAMARLSSALYGDPWRDLVMVGVTGTNGKTTVAHLVGAVMEHAGRTVSVLGTLSGRRTTPEAPELQRTLAGLRDRRRHRRRPTPVVVMEVSSHALAQGRVDPIRFDVAVFTNLSHDHLDFHETMEGYFGTKASLFTAERADRGVVGAFDRWGRRLLEQAPIPLVAVSEDQLSGLRLEPGRSTFAWRGQEVTVAMTGAVNARNALLAAETAVAMGMDPAVVAAGLATAPPVRGRLEVVAGPGPSGPPFTVLVDYAHTPAALEAVLGEARRLATTSGGRVGVVFGCGGHRDRAKRPLMGAAATRIADLAVVTTDNPRHEDPAAIIEQVVAGAVPSAPDAMASGRLAVELDRVEAIGQALRWAGRGDVVVLAGKGHETVQEVGDDRIPLDDAAVARRVLADLGIRPRRLGGR